MRLEKTLRVIITSVLIAVLLFRVPVVVDAAASTKDRTPEELIEENAELRDKIRELEEENKELKALIDSYKTDNKTKSGKDNKEAESILNDKKRTETESLSDDTVATNELGIQPLPEILEAEYTDGKVQIFDFIYDFGAEKCSFGELVEALENSKAEFESAEANSYAAYVPEEWIKPGDNKIVKFRAYDSIEEKQERIGELCFYVYNTTDALLEVQDAKIWRLARVDLNGDYMWFPGGVSLSSDLAYKDIPVLFPHYEVRNYDDYHTLKFSGDYRDRALEDEGLYWSDKGLFYIVEKFTEPEGRQGKHNYACYKFAIDEKTKKVLEIVYCCNQFDIERVDDTHVKNTRTGYVARTERETESYNPFIISIKKDTGKHVSTGQSLFESHWAVATWPVGDNYF